MEILRKPENRGRISPLSLAFMLQDYIGTIGEAQQPPPENVMLIVECALLTSETPAVRGGVMLLGQITPPKHAAELLDLLNRANAFLDSHGMSDNEAAETTERLAQRLGRVSDDDL
jgi:hypothetical protein